MTVGRVGLKPRRINSHGIVVDAVVEVFLVVQTHPTGLCAILRNINTRVFRRDSMRLWLLACSTQSIGIDITTIISTLDKVQFLRITSKNKYDH